MKQLKKHIDSDAAWNRLFDRLETDGLLPDEKGAARIRIFKPVYYKWAAAIAIICVSAATLFLTTQRRQDVQKDLLSVENKKGAVTLAATLEDGSIVYLGDDTRLEYPIQFEKDLREVFLKGKAMFDISGNKDRPFMIETKEMKVEVIGTSFYINSESNTVFELGVQRGQVRVIHKKDGKELFVEAGETVRLHSEKLHLYKTEDNQIFNSYTKRIQFKDESLVNILKVINKELDNSSLQASPEVENRLLTFTFSNNSPENVAQYICLALDLNFTKENEIIMISGMNK